MANIEKRGGPSIAGFNPGCGRLMSWGRCRHPLAGIKLERKKEKSKKWDWKPELIKTTLFLRESKEDISNSEWKQWLRSWKLFTEKIHKRHRGLACYLAYAIGIARRDENLMDLAHKSINAMHASDDAYRGVIRDIDRVVIFMKAATSKNRTDPVIRRHMKSREITTA